MSTDDQKSHQEPPPYQSHDPTSLSFPQVPTELPPIQPVAQNAGTLPSLSETVSDQSKHWPSLNPLTAYYSSHAEDEKMDTSPDRPRSNSVSLDDPDVRMAAEALGDLRAGMSEEEES